MCSYASRTPQCIPCMLRVIMWRATCIVGQPCTLCSACHLNALKSCVASAQYNRGGAWQAEPLPSKHVDTGMGMERVTSVLQGKARARHAVP